MRHFRNSKEGDAKHRQGRSPGCRKKNRQTKERGKRAPEGARQVFSELNCPIPGYGEAGEGKGREEAGVERGKCSTSPSNRGNVSMPSKTFTRKSLGLNLQRKSPGERRPRFPTKKKGKLAFGGMQKKRLPLLLLGRH